MLCRRAHCKEDIEFPSVHEDMTEVKDPTKDEDQHDTEMIRGQRVLDLKGMEDGDEARDVERPDACDVIVIKKYQSSKHWSK